MIFTSFAMILPSFAIMADTTSQTIWTMNIRHENQTLLCSDLYKKIPVEISCETI